MCHVSTRWTAWIPAAVLGGYHFDGYATLGGCHLEGLRVRPTLHSPGTWPLLPRIARREYMVGGLDPQAAPSPKEIAMLLARFACNNHTICDDELRPLGAPPPPTLSQNPVPIDEQSKPCELGPHSYIEEWCARTLELQCCCMHGRVDMGVG